MPFAKTTTSALALAALSATAAAARDQVQVAGSSTVLPYASIVAEAFGENFPTSTDPGCRIRRLLGWPEANSARASARTPSTSPTPRAPFASDRGRRPVPKPA
jgi:hypothetical protein